MKFFIKNVRPLLKFVPLIFAETKPHWANPNLDVLYIRSGRADMQLRRKLIQEAKHSIDVIVFSQSMDDVGSPITQDLRNSLNAGRDVRVIYDGVATGIDGGDFKSESGHLLTDSSLHKQAQVIAPGFFAKFRRHLSYDDFIHEKIVIVDRGTPDVKIIIGGRNHSHTAFVYRDSTFVLRPIDPTQPWAGADLEAYYEKAWSEYSKIFPVIHDSNPSDESLAKIQGVFPSFLKSDADESEYKNITDLLAVAPAPASRLNAVEFQPSTFQFSSNDLMAEANDLAEDHVASRRSLHSDNLNLIASFLPSTHSIFLSAYGMGFPNDIKEKFLEFSRDPAHQFTIMTNSLAAYESIVKADGTHYALANVANVYTVSNLLPFLEQSRETGAHNVKVFRSSPMTALTDPASAFYLHHKYMVLDHKVVTGSDNYTYSSAFRNSEIIVVMDDARLAEFLTQDVHLNLDAQYSPLTVDEAESEVADRGWYNGLLKGIIKQTM
jgi:phosphatidylserine/phosphatidylglycerophosphate/cardiolipin synthase-like enzyme